MPRERENSDTSGAPGQSNRPPLNHRDSGSSQAGGDQTGGTHHHRAKGPKHVVGASRLHGKVPSSKGLHKHHGSTSMVKLNRSNTANSRLGGQGGSPTSPDRAPFFAPGHRRSTSQDLATIATNLKKNTSTTALKRNRSIADVPGAGKGKAKSSSNLLKRSSSNPAVHKLKGERHSKVHFNIGDDGQDDEEDQDEWVDASTSASPLLSRRGSTINGAETSNENQLHPLASAVQGHVDRKNNTSRVPQIQYQFPSHQQRVQPSNNTGAPTGNIPQQQQQQKQRPEQQSQPQQQQQSQQQQSQQQQQQQQQRQQRQQRQEQQVRQPSKPPTNKNSSSQTSIAPSIAHSTTSQSHSQLLTERILKRVPSMISAPKMSTENVQVQLNASRQTSPASSIRASQVRPGSSGKEEVLTSRFIGGEQVGSTGNPSNPGESFLTSIRATTENGTSRSMGSLEHAGKPVADSDDEAAGTEIRRTTRRRNGTQTSVSSGVYGIPKDLNRTQQKINLQRQSSGLDQQPHVPPHLQPGMPLTPGLPINGNGYDNRTDPRLTKVLERTGMEYLVVRRYQNPVARSIARIAQFQALQNGSLNTNGRSSRPGTSHSKRGSELGGGRPSFLRDGREPRDSFLAQATIGNANQHHHSNSMSAIPSKAVSAAARFSGLGGIGTRANSTSSSLDGDGDQPHVGMLANGSSSRLSGSSLVDRSEHAETQAILRALWDKSLDLSASQE